MTSKRGISLNRKRRQTTLNSVDDALEEERRREQEINDLFNK